MAVPARFFKLLEEDIRMRVESLDRQTDGVLAYRESANLQPDPPQAGRNRHYPVA
jgi:hypothetical protein